MDWQHKYNGTEGGVTQIRRDIQFHNALHFLLRQLLKHMKHLLKGAGHSKGRAVCSIWLRLSLAEHVRMRPFHLCCKVCFNWDWIWIRSVRVLFLGEHICATASLAFINSQWITQKATERQTIKVIMKHNNNKTKQSKKGCCSSYQDVYFFVTVSNHGRSKNDQEMQNHDCR